MGKRSKEAIKEHDIKKVKRTKNIKKQLKNVHSKSNEEIADGQVKKKQISTTVSNKDSDGQKSMKDMRSKKKSNKDKKIIIGDEVDEDQEVPVNNTRDKKNTQNIQNDDEVKDEDIDKFCDELEEKDNEEYENWVKLIEAKLSSNKKKS